MKDREERILTKITFPEISLISLAIGHYVNVFGNSMDVDTKLDMKEIASRLASEMTKKEAPKQWRGKITSNKLTILRFRNDGKYKTKRIGEFHYHVIKKEEEWWVYRSKKFDQKIRMNQVGFTMMPQLKNLLDSIHAVEFLYDDEK